MANKKCFWQILAAGLVFGLLAVACTHEIDGKLEITDKKAPQVKKVTVTKTTDNKYYIVSWDGVAADLEYEVYFQKDGNKDSTSVRSGQNTYKYDEDNGSSTLNGDPDKWSIRVNSLDNYTNIPGSFRFGVRSVYKSGLGGNNVIPSDAKWADPIEVTAGPQVASVTATKTTDGRYIIVSWTAVAGANNNYTVTIQRDNSTVVSGGSGQNSLVYAAANGASSANTDPTKWSYLYAISGGLALTSTYRCGVNADFTRTDVSVIPAETKWSSFLTVDLVSTALTANTWASGSIASSGGEQWFRFTATANTHYIHFNPDTLTYIFVQLYDSNLLTVGAQTSLSSYGNLYTSRSVTSGQTYYVRVIDSYYYGPGDYQIAVNTSDTPPAIP